eukprot:361885-Chlamydomonas_euryale.AAC.2
MHASAFAGFEQHKLTCISKGLHAPTLAQVRELKDSSLVVRQKSLLAARELLGSGVSYVQCIAAGITPAVVALMTVRRPWL